jgi:hypothetical protein
MVRLGDLYKLSICQIPFEKDIQKIFFFMSYPDLSTSSAMSAIFFGSLWSQSTFKSQDWPMSEHIFTGFLFWLF